MKRNLMAALTTVAAAAALAIPGAATAGTAGGGGSAPITIDTYKFIGYSCVYYGPAHPYTGAGQLYNCSGGVRTKADGARYWGTKCVEHLQGWGWYQKPCGSI